MSLESEAAMQKVFGKVKEVHSMVPKGIMNVLELISHPDVIETTWAWLEEEFVNMPEEDDDDDSISTGIGGYYG